MIGEAIKWHLEVNGCSQYKLAARLCVSRSVITNLCKSDSNPTYNTVKRVAKALGVNHIDIYTRADKLLKEKENENN